MEFDTLCLIKDFMSHFHENYIFLRYFCLAQFYPACPSWCNPKGLLSKSVNYYIIAALYYNSLIRPYHVSHLKHLYREYKEMLVLGLLELSIWWEYYSHPEVSFLGKKKTKHYQFTSSAINVIQRLITSTTNALMKNTWPTSLR